MIYFVYGAVGALAVLGLLALGFFIGWKCRKKFEHNDPVPMEEMTEEHRHQMLAQQMAFESMLNYNQDTAYGLNGGTDQ